MEQNQNKERQQRGCRRRAQRPHLERPQDRACLFFCRESVESIVFVSGGDPARSSAFSVCSAVWFRQLTCPGRFLRWAAQPTRGRIGFTAATDWRRQRPPQTSPSLLLATTTQSTPLGPANSHPTLLDTLLLVLFAFDFSIPGLLVVSLLARDTFLFFFFPFFFSLAPFLPGRRLHHQAACLFPGTDLVHASSYPQTPSFFPPSLASGLVACASPVQPPHSFIVKRGKKKPRRRSSRLD